MEKTDIVIIGAGVIGLAVALQTVERHPQKTIILLEQHETFGQETSSRNSEVIHAGIYYPRGSLKARLCVEGKDLLYDFCQRWDIPYQKTGKLIIARNPSEIVRLEDLMEQGAKNGVDDLVYLEKAQVRRLEPHICAESAILSPSTGVIHSHRLMSQLDFQARQKGVLVGYRHQVTAVERTRAGYRVDLLDPENRRETLNCQWLINAAGLHADRIAAMLGLDLDRFGYRIRPCKGEYFSIDYAKSNLVSRLVYPPPLEGLTGLGIHLTRSLDGRLRLGPNAFFVEELDYRVDPDHAGEFYEAARTFLPFLELTDLQPEMAGIRPKLQGSEKTFRDFIIQHEKDRGLEGAVNLVGIESPGLTCCLSIGRMVADLIYC